MRQTFSPLESLHRLSLMLGHAQEMSHEVRLFVDWLNQEAAPGWIAFFAFQQQKLVLLAARGFESPASLEVPPETPLWEWLKPPARLKQRVLLPLVIAGQKFGILALAGEQEDAEWEPVCMLAETGLMYLGLVLRNLRHLEQVEKLVEERTAALRESEERFRLLAESALSGIYLIQDGLFRYVNPALAAVFKYEVEELIDRLGPLDLTHPDDRAMVQENIRRRIEGETPSVHYRFRGLCKDGSVRDIEALGRVISYRGRPAIIGTLLDVTEQRRHERELQAQAMLAQAIAEENQLQPLLERLLEAARQVIPNAEKGSILLLEEDGQLRIRALNGYSDPRIYTLRFAQEQGYSARALRQRSPLRIADARSDPQIRYDGEIEEVRQIQSAIVAPLWAHGEVIGVISLDATRKDAFTEQDLQRLTHFATTAALLIERERLFESAHARLHELELLYQSALKFTQARTVAEVAEGLVEALRGLFSWHHFAVRLLEPQGQALHLVTFDVPQKDAEQKQFLLERAQTAIPTLEHGLSGLAIRRGQTILASDVHAFPEYVETAPGIRSGLYVPLKRDDQVLGVIAVESDRPEAFGPMEARWLETLAAQAADAFERLHWMETTRRRAEESSALLSASLALNQLDLQQTLETIVNHARQLFQADSCRIFLIEEDSASLRCVAASGEAAEALLHFHLALNQGVTGSVALSGRAEIVPDMTRDPRAIPVPGTEDSPEAAMFAPLKSAERILGVISVHRQDVGHAFSPSDLEFLQAFAAMASSAVQNALLFEELKQRLYELERLHETSEQLSKAVNLEEMKQVVLRSMIQLTGAEMGILYLRNIEGEWVAQGWENAQGKWQALPVSLRCRAGEGLTGWVGERGEMHITQDWRTDPLQVSPQEKTFLEAYHSGISLPLRSGGETIGVLHLWFSGRREIEKSEERLLMALADMAGNAVQRARLWEETLQRIQQLEAIAEIDRAILNIESLDLVLDVLLRRVITQLKASAAGVLLLSEGNNLLQPARCSGMAPGSYSAPLWAGEDVVSKAAFEQRPLYLLDLQSPTIRFARPALLKEGFRSYAMMPLRSGASLLGVLEVFHRAEFSFDAEWKRLLEMLAQQTAIAVEKTRAIENLRKAHMELSLAYEETIEGWSRALDLRDQETEGHTQRVTELTLRLARAMNLPPEQLVHIRRGALLHDIGKMGVPDAILFKKGPLTEEEWEIMRQHPVYAYEMLSPIRYLRPALEIPYCHHERWDGSGYPRGLKGEEIPLAARLFAVADVYDALTSHRPYRPAWTQEEALEYLRQQAGKLFDPRVVELFLKIVRER
jgi:PAS domain S-box-containing protein